MHYEYNVKCSLDILKCPVEGHALHIVILQMTIAFRGQETEHVFSLVFYWRLKTSPLLNLSGSVAGVAHLVCVCLFILSRSLFRTVFRFTADTCKTLHELQATLT